MPLLAPEAVLGGRYQLERRLSSDGLVETWAAVDEVLARRVVVEAVSPEAGGETRAAFVASAAAAGRIVHPGVVATYDSGEAEGVPYIVTERPAGPTLAEIVRKSGPVGAARVVRLGRQLARALEAAHRLGVAHGGVSPASVVIGEDDRLKLSRFAACGVGRAGASQATDVRDAARTLVAALLGCEQLPDGVVSARAERAGVPRALDDVLVAAQRAGGSGGEDAGSGVTVGAGSTVVPDGGSGVIADAGALVAALERLDLEDDALPAVGRDPTPPLGTPVRPPPLRPAGTRSGAVAGVVVGALIAAALGVAAVLLSSGGNGLSGQPGPTPTSAPGSGRGGELPITAAMSFNPFGDGPEHAGDLGNLTDGDPTTTWTTETYASRQFGGLKSGDGVFVALSGVRTLHQLTVTSPSRGWTMSVFVARQPASTLAGWGQPVGAPTIVQSDVTTVDLGSRQGAAVLVWITQLPSSGPFRVAIGELAVR